tara:strand:+ start:6472 stop:7110 length:639 start_codon:yes stop_codon:yes gene_type:complete
MKYVIALGFVAVIVSVFAYTTLFDTQSTDLSTGQKVSETISSEDQAKSEASESEKQVGRATLENLRLFGQDLECSIRYRGETDTEAVDGTFFIADGRTRGDFLTESPDLDGQILSSIILDNDMLYTWSEIDGEKYGMKMDMSVVESIGGEDQVKQQAVPMDQDVQYECVPWRNVDNTVFEPPTEVLFQDFSELLNSGMEYGTIYETGAEMPY